MCCVICPVFNSAIHLQHKIYNIIQVVIETIGGKITVEFVGGDTSSIKRPKMVTRVEIKGMDAFSKFTESIDNSGPPVFFYFSGSKLPGGESWCPDCVEAEPVVQAYLNELQKNIIFAYVDVGDRDYWKDKMCPFRTDARTKLMVIPTIIRWKGVQRLEGSQCNKRDLLQMMFEDEE